MPTTSTTYYDLLGVSDDATTDDIKAAYRRAARKLHPDVAGPGMESLFNQVRIAHDVLTDPERRAQYDAELAGPPPAPEPDPAPWGTEETIVEDDPVPGPVPEPATSTPLERNITLAQARKTLIVMLTPLAFLILTIVYAVVSQPIWRALAPQELMYTASAAPMVLALTPLMLLRAYRASGKIPLAIMLAITVVEYFSGEWSYLVACILGIITAELWRVRVRLGRKFKAAEQWEAFQTEANGRDLWVMSVAPQGNRTLALLQNPYTMTKEQTMVWGTVVPGTWIVLGDARDVVLACPEEARVAWEELYA